MESSVVKIKLAKFGPPMWFLEDIENGVSVHLTCVQEKPVELDLSRLSKPVLSYFVGSVSSGAVECVGVPLSELLEMLTPKKEVTEGQEETQEEKTEEQKMKEELEERFLSSEVRRQRHKEKMLERCEYISTQSFKVIKSVLAEEDEPLVLIEVLKYEMAGKNRKMVKRHLQKKINAIKKVRFKEFSDELEEQDRAVYNGSRQPHREVEDQLGYEVEEEEDKLIVL
jgi:hypothetical protein